MKEFMDKDFLLSNDVAKKLVKQGETSISTLK